MPLALFVVALKDVTTPQTRPLAFALSTNLLNCGVVFSLNAVEALRAHDLRVGGSLISGLRLSVVAAVFLGLVELLLVYLYIFDVRVEQSEEGATVMVARKPPGLTWPPRPRAALCDCAELVRDSVRDRRFFQLAVYDVLMTGARNQWAAMTMLMVTYLTRAFGEATPAYAIRSINPTLLTVAPALLTPLVSHLEPFAAIMPALWLFCLAPLPMAFAPSTPIRFILRSSLISECGK